MKLTLQLVIVVLNAQTNLLDNLLKHIIWIILLPHTNTVILLERLCGTITKNNMYMKLV